MAKKAKDTTLDGLPQLQRDCDRCRGTGRVTKTNYMFAPLCEVCFGSGKIPTAAGEAVLDLIKRNLWGLNAYR